MFSVSCFNIEGNKTDYLSIKNIKRKTLKCSPFFDPEVNSLLYLIYLVALKSRFSF